MPELNAHLGWLVELFLEAKAQQRVLLTQLLQSTTRRGASLAEERMQPESIIHKLYSIFHISKDLTCQKKIILFSFLYNFKKIPIKKQVFLAAGQALRRSTRCIRLLRKDRFTEV